MATRRPNHGRERPRWRELCHSRWGKAVILNNSQATRQTNLKVLQRIGLPRGANPVRKRELDSRACGFARHAGDGEAYNEEAFHYLLDLERKRSAISNRPFLVLLVEFTNHAGSAPSDIDDVTAGKIFSILAQCLRETDFIGWYDEPRVAGVVLTQNGETDWDEVSETVRRRVGEALEKHFPSTRAKGPQMRVYPL